jgi:hypothetical protein
MAPEDVRRLFEFIDWVLEQPDPLEHRFQEETDAFQREKRMPFVNIFERVGMEKGLLRGIEVALRMKFGAEGLELMPELHEIWDNEVLHKVLHRIKTVDSPAALRRYWTRIRRRKRVDPMREVYRLEDPATPAPRRSGRRRS